MNVTEKELEQLKRQFVVWWIKFPNEPYKAACIVFPDPKEMGTRLTVAHDWPNDAQVLMYRNELLNGEQAEKLLPSKHELMADLYEIAKRSHDDDAKIKAINAIAQLAGHIKAPGVQINNNNRIGNNSANTVMLVPDYGSDDDWQEALIQQQQKLIATDIDAEPNNNS